MISMSELDGDGWIHDISYTYDDNDECQLPTTEVVGLPFHLSSI